MLYIIGLGLADGDISARGIEALESADVAYAEFYTNSIDHDLEALEDRTGTGIEELERGGVEEEDRLVEEAGERDVAFLVSGDPLAATTHQDILFRARQRGIGTEVMHAPSVFTAVAETGLSLYKFGRATTLTVQNGEVPDSVFEAVEMNRENGLHTLVLVEPEMDHERGLELFGEEVRVEVIVCCGLGTPEKSISRQELSDMELEEPVSLVVPGELSENEEGRLEQRLNSEEE